MIAAGADDTLAPMVTRAALASILVCISCTPDSPARKRETTFTIRDTFESYGLGLGASFFHDNLEDHPDISSCHTQGIAVMGLRLYVSCSLYAPDADRTKKARSLLLATSLKAILAGKPDRWQVRDITTAAKKSPELVLGHPSGLVGDAHGVWVATAVYAPNSESLVTRYDPTSLAQQKDAPSFRIDDHIGALFVHKDGPSLIGFNWDAKEMVRMVEGAEPKKSPSPSSAAYQDCVTTKRGAVCVGESGDEARIERLPPNLSPIRLKVPTLSTGATQNPITHEGFTTAGGRAYFLPDDLPNAKLIRVAWPLAPLQTTQP